MNDGELLRRYSREGCEEAFRELVGRHLNLVFSAALRQVGGNRALAEDVAQMVFSDLARKAGTLTERQTISGWLYTSARFAAAKVARGESRRTKREEEVFVMQESVGGEMGNPPPGGGGHGELDAMDWRSVAPALDEAMHELKETDRDAILLRFFEERPFAEVGARLGVSEDGARMRVERALEKLRGALERRGVSGTCAGLGAALAAESVSAAPAGLAGTISSAALSGAAAAAAAGGAGAAAALEIFAMTKLKMAAAAVVLAGVAVPLTMQQRSNEELRAANTTLAAKNAELAAALDSLAGQNARLSNAVSISSGQQNTNLAELLRLRAEVTRARQDSTGRAVLSGDPIDPMLQQWSERVAQLRERMQNSPHLRIPELQYLSDKAWLDAAARVKSFETEDDYRRALSDLRASAKGEVGRMLQDGIRRYANAHDGLLPSSLEEVAASMEKPVDAAILSRYEWVSAGATPGKGGAERTGEVLIREIAPPVDEEHDTRFEFLRNGGSSSSFSVIGTAIQEAAERYARANGGLLPREVSDLTGYLERPVEAERVRRFLQEIPPGVTTLAEMRRREN